MPVSAVHANSAVYQGYDSGTQRFPLAHTGMGTSYLYLLCSGLTEIMGRSTVMLFRTEMSLQPSTRDLLLISDSSEWLNQKLQTMLSLVRISSTSSICRKYVFGEPQVILEYADTAKAYFSLYPVYSGQGQGSANDGRVSDSLETWLRSG